MASAQLASKVKLIAQRRDGASKKVTEGHVSVFAPAGGAPDGALASTTAIDARHVIPAGGPMLRPDDKILVEVTTEAGDGVDASDCVWAVPVTEYDVNGRVLGVKHLSRGDFTSPAFADYTAVADIPVVVAGYPVTEAGLKIGGSHILLDIQNDT